MAQASSLKIYGKKLKDHEKMALSEIKNKDAIYN